MKTSRRSPEEFRTLERILSAHSKRRRQTRVSGLLAPRCESEYDFLLDHFITADILSEAVELATQWQVPVHQVLISEGWITQADYTRALAEYSSVKYLQKLKASQLNLPNIPQKIHDSYRAGLFTGFEQTEHGRVETVILASGAPTSPVALKRMMDRLGAAGQRLYLVSSHQLRHAISSIRGSLLTSEAIYGLENTHPRCSASHGLTSLQQYFLWMLLFIGLSGAIIYPDSFFIVINALLSVMFFPIVWLRFKACIHALKRPLVTSGQTPNNLGWWRTAAIGLAGDTTLPVYTVLVPIFREKEVLHSLIRALLDLDYPSAKLDIKLIFEECDQETLAVAKTIDVPDHIEFIIVPDSQPRTKPKALNYAIQFARGDYVVIYDAEDQPAPDQLRKAVTAFRLAPESVACLQSRLTFYNASENWLTRQFAIEYAALFNAILPTLQSLDYPIPLGGTSNHFRMSALKQAGAWDAFNVTEDADLGIRLYRSGFSCRVLNSVTYEEATCSIRDWLPQRTRWIKGWMQTYAVHMRNPLKLYRQLGPVGFSGFHIMIGGFLVSAFIHPLFLGYLIYAMLIAFVGGGIRLELPENPFWWVAFFNLLFGYSTAMALGAIVSWQSGMKRFIPHVLTMPVYWILISLAACRAFFQFFRNPFLWEKTKHGVSKLHRLTGNMVLKNGGSDQLGINQNSD